MVHVGSANHGLVVGVGNTQGLIMLGFVYPVLPLQQRQQLLRSQACFQDHWSAVAVLQDLLPIFDLSLWALRQLM